MNAAFRDLLERLVPLREMGISVEVKPRGGVDAIVVRRELAGQGARQLIVKGGEPDPLLEFQGPCFVFRGSWTGHPEELRNTDFCWYGSGSTVWRSASAWLVEWSDVAFLDEERLRDPFAE